MITDPIRGYFRVSNLCMDVVNTVQFQRLRDLKQLGLTCYVFPGATHHRFEHSLGTAHLGWRWAKQLLGRQGAGSDNAHYADLIEVAGLCHDLGHGPFSHVFDNEILPRIVSPEIRQAWSHEDMSTRILRHIIDENCIDVSHRGMIQEDLGTISALMTGHRPAGCTEKKWIYDIVANKRNSIDVDKFDYLARDAYYVGVNICTDPIRIMQHSKVIDDQICFKDEMYDELVALFQDRARMHSKVYTKSKIKAVEFMVVDALVAAEPVLRIADKLNDVESYLTLDDTIVKRLQFMDADATEAPAAVRKAQALLQRLARRELYSYCEQIVLSHECKNVRTPSPEDIASFHTSDGLVTLNPEDIIISEVKINFSLDDDFPLDYTLFYNKDECFPLRKDVVSNMLPERCQDRKIRIFCRTSNKQDNSRLEHAAREAFGRWVDKHCSKSGCYQTTPFKKRKLLPDDNGGGSGSNGGDRWRNGCATVEEGVEEEGC